MGRMPMPPTPFSSPRPDVVILHNDVFYENSSYSINFTSNIGDMCTRGPQPCSFCRTLTPNDKPCANCGAPR